MNPTIPLRGGIIGCGFFAQFHIEAWRRMPEVELAAAVDPDLERTRKAAPRAYATAEEMLDTERLDFVDIATRPDSHAELVRLAASRSALRHSLVLTATRCTRRTENTLRIMRS